MKLSQLSTDKALDIMCDITPYVANIAKDKEFIKTYVNKAIIKDNTKPEIIREVAFKTTIEKFEKFIPLIFKKHRIDVYNILAILNEKDISEIEKMSLPQIITEVKETLMDKEMMDFFTSLLS